MRLEENMQGKKVFIMGAGGIGMSALARLLNSRGALVTGWDASPSPVLQDLAGEGVEIVKTPSMQEEPFDWLIHTHAITEEHPFIHTAREEGVPISRRGEVIVHLLDAKRSIGITGSHGKTTVTFLTGTLFNAAGLKPTILGGGIDQVLNSNCQIGVSDWLVAELDESDRTFCTAKPSLVAVTSLDHEHVNAFPHFIDLEEAFRDFFEQLPPETIVLLNADDTRLTPLVEELKVHPRIIGVGKNPRAPYQLISERTSESGLVIETRIKGKKVSFECEIFGKHHAMNMLLAAGLAHESGLSCEAIQKGFLEFRGIRRRMECLTRFGDHCSLFSDYAHHPTEVRAVLQSLKDHDFSGKKVAVFEAHRLSRMNAFFDGFVSALQVADEIILADCYTAGEGGDSKALLDKLQEALLPKSVVQVANKDLWSYVQDHYTKDTTLILLSAGKLDPFMREAVA